LNKAIFLTVRTGSSRLPNKSLMRLGEETTTEFLIKRLKESKLADFIVLCTTSRKQDNVLCRFASENDIKYFQGSEDDKLERWRGACEKYDVDFFVTADGDDLLCEPELIDLAFKQYEDTGPDFIQCKDIICGAFTYGIKTAALNKVCEIKDTDQTEMMWVYFTDTGLFNVKELENVPDAYKRADIRMTLDYWEDFNFFDTIIQHLGKENLQLQNIVSLLDREPEIKEINFHRQADFLKNQKEKTTLKIRGSNV